jgi:carboxyl-terminal processing protease
VKLATFFLADRCRQFAHAGLYLASVFLAACGGGGSGSPAVASPGSPSAVAMFDEVWNDFDLSYSFFVLKGFDWNDSLSRFRSLLGTNSTDAELFDVVSGMLLELEDGHVSLNTPLGNSAYTGWFDQYPANFDEAVVSTTYLGQSAMMTPQANMLFGRLTADIGYVRVHSLGGTGYGEDIDYMLGQLAGIRGMVVDLRSNGGGNDQNGEAVAARFADSSRLYRRVQFRDGPNHDDFGPLAEVFVGPAGTQAFRGPVAVLTNRSTFSSAESTLLAFAVFPNTVSVGDFTGGGSANPSQRTLANGWSYTVSRWIEYLPDGSTFEGTGIAPDIRTDISAADAAALRDTIIDAAIENLESRISP